MVQFLPFAVVVLLWSCFRCFVIFSVAAVTVAAVTVTVAAVTVAAVTVTVAAAVGWWQKPSHWATLLLIG